jgi:hypothetical protein
MTEMNVDYFRQLQVQKHEKAIKEVCDLFLSSLHYAVLGDKEELIMDNHFYFTHKAYENLSHKEKDAFVSFLKLKGFQVKNKVRDSISVSF